jgi:ribosomal protein S12 methylthiotransferase
MQQQQEIAFAQNRARVGRELDVIVEKRLSKGRWEGRTAGDAPEIDTAITLHGDSVREGRIGRARVTGWTAYDLIGDLV